MAMPQEYIRWFSDLGIGDVASVGGENASSASVWAIAAHLTHRPAWSQVTEDRSHVP
jgi:hypothetical protein